MAHLSLDDLNDTDDLSTLFQLVPLEDDYSNATPCDEPMSPAQDDDYSNASPCDEPMSPAQDDDSSNASPCYEPMSPAQEEDYSNASPCYEPLSPAQEEDYSNSTPCSEPMSPVKEKDYSRATPCYEPMSPVPEEDSSHATPEPMSPSFPKDNGPTLPDCRNTVSAASHVKEADLKMDSSFSPCYEPHSPDRSSGSTSPRYLATRFEKTTIHVKKSPILQNRKVMNDTLTIPEKENMRTHALSKRKSESFSDTSTLLKRSKTDKTFKETCTTPKKNEKRKTEDTSLQLQASSSKRHKKSSPSDPKRSSKILKPAKKEENKKRDDSTLQPAASSSNGHKKSPSQRKKSKKVSKNLKETSPKKEESKKTEGVILQPTASSSKVNKSSLHKNSNSNRVSKDFKETPSNKETEEKNVFKNYTIPKRKMTGEATVIRKTIYNERARTPEERKYDSYNSRWRSERGPYKVQKVCHRNITGVLAVNENGFTLTNGIESWCFDNVQNWDDILYNVRRMNILNLHLIGQETERRWQDLKDGNVWHNFAKKNFYVNVTLQPDLENINENICYHCHDPRCHRWRAIQGGIKKISTTPIEPIRHNLFFKKMT